MKTSAFYQLKPGAALHLKPERAAAYGLPDRLVHFEGIKERANHSTPWILATDGSYRPADFAKAVPQQDDK